MPAPIPLPPRSVLLRVFIYHPKTGVLIRKWRDGIPHRINKRCAGKISGSRAKSGHLVVSIGHQRYLAHRVIWKMLYDEEPNEIDHRNLNPSDNRKVNLRACGRSENGANAASRKRITKHLPKGVYPNRTGRKYNAKIRVMGHRIYLGSYITPKLAHAVYCRAAKELHGEFARFN
jgi:hypothetical protein